MWQTYLDLKRREWEDYMNHVCAWEVDRYLKFFIVPAQAAWRILASLGR